MLASQASPWPQACPVGQQAAPAWPQLVAANGAQTLFTQENPGLHALPPQHAPPSTPHCAMRSCLPEEMDRLVFVWGSVGAKQPIRVTPPIHKHA
jgi:hypothetical protein